MVPDIGGDAFADTAWYRSQPDGVVCVRKTAYCVKGDCPETLVIEDGILNIADEAFASTPIKSVVFPDSLTKIGSYAFHGCTSLTDVTLPGSVRVINQDAFAKCTSLTNIVIPDSVEKIDRYAFFGCTSLSSVTVPESVTDIGECAFGYLDYHNGKIPDFTLIGAIGSAAEKYAEENGFGFIPIDPILGDADCDGTVTILDATAIQRKLANLPTDGFFHEKDADISDDGLDIIDATLIQRHLANLPCAYAIGETM